MARKQFVKGQSGNPKGIQGIPPRKRARLKVQEILDMEDFSPFYEMVKLFRETKKERVKVDILIELCNYIAPKMKHIEMSSDIENPFIINLQIDPLKKKIPVVTESQTQLVNTIIGEDDETG